MIKKEIFIFYIKLISDYYDHGFSMSLIRQIN